VRKRTGAVQQDELIDPADAEQLAKLLRRHRIDLKHSLGQNFLIDPAMRDAVAEAAGSVSNEEVIEVGAGVGTLTIALADRHPRVIAVELDRRLIPALREVVEGRGRVEILEADILKLDIGELYPDGGEVVAGNIPYNLTGALIRKLLDRPPRPRRLSLVVQKEVADRWTAATGASLATVAVQVFAEARLGFTIPAAAFTPVPRVDSALVVLEVRERPAVEVADMDGFFRLVEAVFQFRRKQLGGALGRIAGVGSEAAASRLRQAGIDPERRAQTLSLVEWELVYRRFAGPTGHAGAWPSTPGSGEGPTRARRPG
jgi:16S rRNA (adenine1518-N6/adenine1519-N6)-dimethyltransferase